MRLDPKIHTWLADKPARRVFDALPKGEARFVGGCVRNALLGAPVADYDIATTLEPKDVAGRLKDAGMAVHETGIDHGTLTAVASRTVFEITTLRNDVTTDGRRATVAFTKDWAEDAGRRDFTINALYASPDGEIFDPTGLGMKDIDGPRIRFVGSAQGRIKEDYLRVLRFFRFSAWYAPNKPMDKEGLDASRELQAGLRNLSAERVWSELKKLLSAPAPERIVNVMSMGGILETLLPEASNAEGLQLLRALEDKAGLAPDPYLRLMSMAARDELAMARLCTRLRMSNAEKKRLKNWAGDITPLSKDLADNLEGKDIKIAVYKAGSQAAMDRAFLRAAGADNPDPWLAIYGFAKTWERPDFPLTGKDLIAAGMKPGAKMGKALEALHALWVRSGLTADKNRLLAALALINR